MITLEARKWYAWQMLPGYVSEGYRPYCSPILIHEVAPKKSGKGIIRLAFANALYAQGVQDFVVDLKVTTRASSYMVGELVESGSVGGARCAIISTIDIDWLRQYCPELIQARPPERYKGLAKTVASQYLNEVFGAGAL